MIVLSCRSPPVLSMPEPATPYSSVPDLAVPRLPYRSASRLISPFRSKPIHACHAESCLSISRLSPSCRTLPALPVRFMPIRACPVCSTPIRACLAYPILSPLCLFRPRRNKPYLSSPCLPYRIPPIHSTPLLINPCHVGPASAYQKNKPSIIL